MSVFCEAGCEAEDLHAEIERLRFDCEEWKTENAAAHKEIERLRAKTTDTAAFLDRAARDLHDTGWVVLADECRAMAKKLEG